jgi:hypothetical protein
VRKEGSDDGDCAIFVRRQEAAMLAARPAFRDLYQRKKHGNRS